MTCLPVSIAAPVIVALTSAIAYLYYDNRRAWKMLARHLDQANKALDAALKDRR